MRGDRGQFAATRDVLVDGNPCSEAVYRWLAGRGETPSSRVDTAAPVPYTGRDGDGHDPRRRVPTMDVGGDGGPATGRRSSVLRVPEPDPERGGLRCFRREALRFVLRADGAASLAPDRYFRLLLVGYFEGLDSERAIAWRAADSLSLRSFLRLAPPASRPDHSTISRTRRLLSLETHEAVFTCVLQQLTDAGLVRGKTVGIDATTLLRVLRAVRLHPLTGPRQGQWHYDGEWMLARDVQVRPW